LIVAAAIDVRVLIPGHRPALVASIGPAALSSARHGDLFARSVQAKIVHCSKSRPGVFSAPRRFVACRRRANKPRAAASICAASMYDHRINQI
jgi:hypothetical protein